MYQNYVVEVKKSFDGEYEHQVYWLYDEDETAARLKAESKYYEILADAALSSTATHSAIIFTAEGMPLMHKCYTHKEDSDE